MDNLSELADSLPSSNKELPDQKLYRPSSTTSSHRGNSHLSRGGFSNQRGPGRGRGRSLGRGHICNSTSGHVGNTSEHSNNSSWGSPNKSANSSGDPGRRFTFKETNGSVQNSKGIESSAKNTAEDQLKQFNNRGSNNKSQGHNKQKIRNTVDFKPDHTPAEMRVLIANGSQRKYHREITSRDVIVVSDLFCKPEDKTIYQNLLKEAEGNKHHEWKLWHGDNHLIADDRTRRNQSYPTFDMIINKIKEFFSMDVHATRFNWFRDTKDWKPYHHDAAAIKPEKAAVQNITVAVSFGTEREIAFQHAKTGSTVSFPLPNGTLYTFSNDVNVIWRHGVPQVPPEKQINEGRISIVAWGWVHGVVNVGTNGKMVGS